MSDAPIDLNPLLQPLVDEGYTIELRGDYLLVHDVPFVGADCSIKRGTLACTFIAPNGVAEFPDQHQMYWSEEFPCYSNGKRITPMQHSEPNKEVFPGFIARVYFSSKANGQMFPDHCSKVRHYVTLISSQANVLDPDATALTKRAAVAKEQDSVFRYPDSASARGEYTTTSARLKLARVAIVGLGGTGSYILDQVAKTPVREIHLFDGDNLKSHNSFRSPGAASLAQLDNKPLKVDHFFAQYDPMHSGLVPHPYYLTTDNIHELNGFDFVFVSVDKGPVRALVCGYLMANNIPFVDVGMQLYIQEDTQRLDGLCRTTLCTPQQHQHFGAYVDTSPAENDGMYDKNIQVADLNALNAIFAVLKWKQQFGFYVDHFANHQLNFTVGTLGLAKAVSTVVPAAGA
jgi:hypothetical protein